MRCLSYLLLIAILLPFVQTSVYADDALGGVIEIGQVEPSQLLVIEEVPDPEPELTITDYVEPEPNELKVEEKIPAPSPTYNFTFTLGPTSTPIELKIYGEKVPVPSSTIQLDQVSSPIITDESSISLPTPTLTPVPMNPPDYPPFGPIPIEENYPLYGPIPINPPYPAPYDPVAIERPVRRPIFIPNRIRLGLRNRLRNNLGLILERISSLAP